MFVRHLRLQGALVLGSAIAVSVTSTAAAAVPDCADISNGRPTIYGAGGSAQRDFIGKAAVVLQGATIPLYVVYNDASGGCSGLYGLTGLGPATISGTGYYWASDGTRLTCNLPPAGEAIDFGAQAIEPMTCPLATDESILDDLVDVIGPISAISPFVQNASTQQSLSSEAFYLIYGLGAPDADVEPWNNPDPNFLITRNENAAVTNILSIATTLPVSKFLNFGVDAGTNSNSVALLVALPEAEPGLAFASSDVTDANRATVRALAWQQAGQNTGYWPDSSATSFDKANVRSGQYELWNPGHFLALGDPATGDTDDPKVQVLLDYMSEQGQPPGTTKTITEVAIDNKNIPWCAMRVNREGDVGPVYAWEHEEPCHCYFDFRTSGATTCATCDDTNPCSGTDVCRFGYCEAN